MTIKASKRAFGLTDSGQLAGRTIATARVTATARPAEKMQAAESPAMDYQQGFFSGPSS